MLYKRSLRYPSKENKYEYKCCRNKLTTIIRLSRILYYVKEFENANGNIASTWKVIKETLRMQKTKSKININNDGQTILDFKEIADCFNRYFVNVGPIQASKINSNGSDYLQFLSYPCNKLFFVMPTNCVEIFNIVNSLKISYSCSHDEMSTHFLKQIAGSIVTPLLHICNLSLTTGVFSGLIENSKSNSNIQRKTTLL